MLTKDSGDSNASHNKTLKGLYAITDEKLISREDFNRTVELALQGGARIIQYRDKSNDPSKRLEQAAAICSLCSRYQATSIINDDIELAKAVNADGVHLGRDDAAISQARKILGNNSIIGVSCYGDLALAKRAEEHGADYVAFGAMFSSSTKPEAADTGPEIITKAKQKISIPVCAIGGINEDNIQQLAKIGADMTAVIHSLFSAEDIKLTATNLSQHF